LQTTQAEISAKVKAQYEAFPYPDYRLWLPLRAQEAYASNSLFAARLSEQSGGIPALRQSGSPGILLAGCGDTYPYLATFWEPRRHRITAMDLSAGSLRRARLRCLPRLRAVDWRQGNLEDPETELPGGLAHIDCYGVLHHLANPARALGRFASALAPGGTARIMVYNSEARGWIRHVQRAFALLGLSAFESADRKRGRRLLEKLARVSPALRDRFAPMRDGAFANAARFVDTFLHAREARLDAGFWLRAIEAAGLGVLGVFDRYGELDDLPNPLFHVPELRAWQARISDRRFENNLELYLAKPGLRAPQGADPGLRLPSPLFLKSPPLSWFAYAETRGIPWAARRRIWSRFLSGIRGRTPGPMDSWADRLAPESLQRLARVGAVFPGDFRDRNLRELLSRPLHASMEPPDPPGSGPVYDQRDIRSEALDILREKNRPAERLEAVMRRFDAAQRP
jgi:SAM-dependent methyltransferase